MNTYESTFGLSLASLCATSDLKCERHFFSSLEKERLKLFYRPACIFCGVGSGGHLRRVNTNSFHFINVASSWSLVAPFAPLPPTWRSAVCVLQSARFPLRWPAPPMLPAAAGQRAPPGEQPVCARRRHSHPRALLRSLVVLHRLALASPRIPPTLAAAAAAAAAL